MKEDVVAANLANLRQSINELKVYIEKQNATVPKPEQSVKADSNEKAIYTGIAKVSVFAGMKPCLWSRNISGNSSLTHCRFRYGSRNSLIYSSRSPNFLNIFIGTFAITIRIV